MIRDSMGYHHRYAYSYYESLITALSIGGFFIILGIVFGLTPGVWSSVSSFFHDLRLVHITTNSGVANFNFPAPIHPNAHNEFYSAVLSFCAGIGILNTVVLVLRLIFHSPINRISSSVGDMIFWFGAAAAINGLLLAGTLAGWYQFWSVLLIIFGLALIARGIIHLVAWLMQKH